MSPKPSVKTNLATPNWSFGLKRLNFSISNKSFSLRFKELIQLKQEDESEFLKKAPQFQNIEELEAYNFTSPGASFRNVLQYLLLLLRENQVSVETKTNTITRIIGNSDQVTYWPLCLRIEALKITEKIGEVYGLLSSPSPGWKDKLSVNLAVNPCLPPQVFIRMLWDKRLNPELFLHCLPLTETNWRFVTTNLRDPNLTDEGKAFLLNKVKEFYPVMFEDEWLDNQVEHFARNMPTLHNY